MGDLKADCAARKAERAEHNQPKPYRARKLHGYDVLSFIEAAKVVHGDKYDYSDVEYTTTLDKVWIRCPKHGRFFQTPGSHIHQGSGCPRCGIERRTKPPLVKLLQLSDGEVAEAFIRAAEAQGLTVGEKLRRMIDRIKLQLAER